MKLNSLTVKLTLICSLFCIPIIYLGALFYREVKVDVVLADRERKGNDLIYSLLDAQNTISLKTIQTNPETGFSPLAPWEKSIQELKKGIEGFQIQSKEAIPLEIQNGLGILESGKAFLSASPLTAEQLPEIKAFMEQLNRSYDHIIQASGLILDPKADSYYLVAALMQDTKMISNAILHWGISTLEGKTLEEKSLLYKAGQSDLQKAVTNIESNVNHSLKDYARHPKASKEVMTSLLSGVENFKTAMQKLIASPGPTDSNPNLLIEMTEFTQSLKSFQKMAYQNLSIVLMERNQRIQGAFESAVIIGFLLLSFTFFLSFVQLKKITQSSRLILDALGTTSKDIQENKASLLKSAQETKERSQKDDLTARENELVVSRLESKIQEVVAATQASFELIHKTYQVSQEASEQAQNLKHSLMNMEKSYRHFEIFDRIIQDVSAKTQAINDIVFKTQLLSVNASIEAARAGHHGKGFAVVAGEVSSLATLSGQAAQEINSLLEASQKEVQSVLEKSREIFQKGNEISQDTLKSFDSMTSLVHQLQAHFQTIVSLNNEQKGGLNTYKSIVDALQSNCQANQSLSSQMEILAHQAKMHSHQVQRIKSALDWLVNGEPLDSENRTQDFPAVPSETHAHLPTVSLPEGTPASAPDSSLKARILAKAKRSQHSKSSEVNSGNPPESKAS